MRAGSTSVVALVICALAAAAWAKPAHHKTAKRSTAAPAARRIAPAPVPAAVPDATASADSSGAADTSEGAAAPATKIKTKTYTFGAMDVEGRLKTPQLLYFLNRVKLELDMSAPDKRSFMKELAQSADDKNL